MGPHLFVDNIALAIEYSVHLLFVMYTEVGGMHTYILLWLLLHCTRILMMMEVHVCMSSNVH